MTDTSSADDPVDVLVVGGGLAGCMTALAAARERPTAAVELVVVGDNRFDHHSGTIDVLGYLSRGDDMQEQRTTSGADPEADPDSDQPVATPLDAIDALPADHPYRRLGRDTLRAALALFDDELDYRGGDSEHNALVATHVGRVRPTARYPAGMATGLASRDEPMRLVGFEQVPDLDGPLVADRLDDGLPYDVAGTTVAFPGTVTDYPSGPVLARALDEDEPPRGDIGMPELTAEEEALPPDSDDNDPDESVREQLIERVRSELAVEPRIGFPAVLGASEHATVRQELEDAFYARVFEIPIGPPSIPGHRLESNFHEVLSEADVAVTHGAVEGFETADGSLERVSLTDGVRAVESVVLATGGLADPGLVADRAGVHEPAFDCYVEHPDDRVNWTAADFLGGHPFARFGVAVDDELRPVDASGRPEYENLRAAGTVLGGVDYAAEQSADGVALATGYAAGRWSLP